MTFAAFVAASLLSALHGPPSVRARALAGLYASETREHGLPAGLLAKMAAHESRNRIDAVGDNGRAFGLLQVHRDAVPGLRYTRAELMDPATNVHAAALRLSWARSICGNRAASMASHFNGRGCGRSSYSRAVLAERGP